MEWLKDVCEVDDRVYDDERACGDECGREMKRGL